MGLSFDYLTHFRGHSLGGGRVFCLLRGNFVFQDLLRGVIIRNPFKNVETRAPLRHSGDADVLRDAQETDDGLPGAPLRS